MRCKSSGWRALPWLLLASLAQANPYETTLANGLKIVVKEDHRAPVVVNEVWYRIGSVDEVNGQTGLSHVLEHLMFKGTKAVPMGQFSKRVAELGGQHNAGTNRDYTFYYQKLPAKALPQALALEADRMQGLLLDEKEFAKEIKVVQEERRMRTENNPGGLMYERFMATAYMAHPYRVPVIGWMDDLQHLSIDEVRTWYQTWYAPNNATLVVVGDVDHQQVFKLAQQHFGKLKPAVLPLRKAQREPEQVGVKRVAIKAPSDLPQLWLGWRAPTLQTLDEREPYALEVLAAVLDGHEGARFNRKLVREDRVALNASASYGGVGRGPSLFFVTGSPAAGKTVAELEAALRAEIKRLADEGITAAELKRVKSQMLASQVYQRDSMYMQAMSIGSLEASGYGWRAEAIMLDKLQQVTASEVQAVAKHYLVDDQLTLGELIPLPIAAQPAQHQGVVHAR